MTHKEPPRHAEPAAEPKKKSAASRLIWLLVLLVLAGGAVYAWRTTRKPKVTAAAAARDANNRLGTPVVAAVSVRQDMPVYLDGLGSVTAFNTVTVKSRVDGELTEIHFREGQDVKKGDLLAVIDPRPYEVALAQAEANLARDQAQLADAKLNADRYDQLVKSGVIPQQQADTQRALAAQLTGAVAADQAQIDSAKLNIVYSHITSPIDGRIGLRLVDQGNIVHAADTNGLLVITQMQPIAVIFTLPEDSLPAVNSHTRGGASLQVLALSRDNGEKLATGSLLTIDNEIDQTTGTYRLKAIFNNEDRALWPNQFVNARMLLDTKKNAIIIPTAAIQRGSNGTFVYVVGSDKTVSVRPLDVGFTEGTVSSVDKGLQSGEMVVTDGQDRLRAGIRVDARVDNFNGVAGLQTTSASAGAAAQAPIGDSGQAGPSNAKSVNPGSPGGQSGNWQGRQGGAQGFGQGFVQGSGQNGGQKKYQRDRSAQNSQ